MEQLISIAKQDLQSFIDYPESLIEQDKVIQIAVATHADTPREFLAILVNSGIDEVADTAQLHVNYAGEIEENWQDIVDQKLKSRYLGQNDKLAVELLKFAPVPDYFLSEWVPGNYLSQALKNPYLPSRYKANLLNRLVHDESLEARLQIAESLETPVAILKSLIGDLKFAVRLAVKHHPNCPLELVKLVKEQQKIASDWDTDKKQLDSLSNSDWDWIRQTVAQNTSTSEETLLKLAEDKVYPIRLAVAKNPATSAIVLAKLAEDSSYEILSKVIKHSNTPSKILIKLGQKPKTKTENSLSSDIFKSYRSSISIEEIKEYEQARQILNRRVNTPYILNKVVETGNQNAKISVIRNPQTPIQVIEKLAKDEDETVRKVVAENKNLPLNILLKLAEDSSFGVRSALAYKNTYSKIQTPVELLEKLAQDESEQIRQEVANHPDTPEELLIKLANDSSINVKKVLIRNLNTPVTVLNRLGLEENLVDASNPNTPAEVLASQVNSILRSQSNSRQSNSESANKPLVELIKHPVKGTKMPIEILDKLASHHYSSVRYRVASHPNTSTSTLEKLARDSYVPTVRAVVDNPKTPPNILEYFAKYTDLTTRLSLVSHPNTPARVLRQFVEDAQKSINAPNNTKDALKSGIFGDAYSLLIAIASSPKTPIDALEIIARREFVTPILDPDSLFPTRTDDDVIRSLVYYNPNLTPELLNILIHDRCVDVRIALTRHSNLTDALSLKLAKDEDVSVRKAIVSQTAIPEILETLAEDEMSDVRSQVAENTNTSKELLRQLSQDTEAIVLTKVAGNPNTPNAVLENLAQDKSVEVRRAVANNSNTPKMIKDSLKDLLPTREKSTQTRSSSSTLKGLSRIYNPKTDDLPTVLSEYSNSEVAFVRFVSLLHPNTPVEILENGANSASWIERYAVADNPNTPTEIKQKLAQDANQIVRAVARNT